MSIETKSCDACDKKVSELYYFNGVELCKECFETLIRVSQYKSITTLNEEEGKVVMSYLKKAVESMK